MSFLIYKVWMVIESTIRFVIGIGQKLIGKEFSEMQIKELLQFVKFGIVGISNSVVNYSTYVTGMLLLNRFFPLVKNGYVVAQTMGFVVSVFGLSAGTTDMCFIWGIKPRDVYKRQVLYPVDPSCRKAAVAHH